MHPWRFRRFAWLAGVSQRASVAGHSFLRMGKIGRELEEETVRKGDSDASALEICVAS